MTGKSADELLVEYRATAALHGRSQAVGESERCNSAHDKLTRIRLELAARGDEHRRRVLAFLGDDDIAVRTWAAVDALARAPDDGVRVLREVAAGPPGMVRLDGRARCFENIVTAGPSFHLRRSIVPPLGTHHSARKPRYTAPVSHFAIACNSTPLTT